MICMGMHRDLDTDLHRDLDRDSEKDLNTDSNNELDGNLDGVVTEYFDRDKDLDRHHLKRLR